MNEFCDVIMALTLLVGIFSLGLIIWCAVAIDAAKRERKAKEELLPSYTGVYKMDVPKTDENGGVYHMTENRENNMTIIEGD